MSSSFSAAPLSPYTSSSSGPVEITDLSSVNFSFSLASSEFTSTKGDDDFLGEEEQAAFFSVFIDSEEPPLLYYSWSGQVESLRNLLVQKKEHFLTASASPPSSSFLSASPTGDDGSDDDEAFDSFEEWINHKNEEGVSALLAACATGQIQCVQMLLEEGADPNLYGDNELTPLLLSCFQGFNEIVELLLRQGASLLPTSHEPKWTPLHAAVFGQHPLVCETLMREREKRRREEVKGKTTSAGLSGDIAAVSNEEGRTPGHFVALHGSGSIGASMAKSIFLADNVSNEMVYTRYEYLSKIDSKTRTPIHLACTRGNIDVLKLFLDFLSELSVLDKNDVADLSLKTKRGDDDDDDKRGKGSPEGDGEDLKRSVLEATDCDGRTPLHLGCLHGWSKVVQLLIDWGADSGVRDDNGLTCFHLAALNANTDALKILLKNATPSGQPAGEKDKKLKVLTRKDYSGRTPLHCAAQSHRGKYSVDCLRLLIEKVENIDPLDDMKRSPLFYACSCPLSSPKKAKDDTLEGEEEEEEGKVDGEVDVEEMKERSNHLCVSFLLKHGADVTLKDSAGRTCIHYVSYVHDLFSLRALVTHIDTHILSSSSPSLSPPSSRISPLSPSPLSPPIEGDSDFLIESVDKHEMTPLHAACSRESKMSSIVITELLDKLCMDLEAKEQRGMTPLMIACARGNTKNVETLVNFDANIHEQDKKGRTCLMLAASTPCASTTSVLRPASALSPHSSPSLSSHPMRVYPQHEMLVSLVDSLSVGEEDVQTLIQTTSSKGQTVFHYLACAPCSLYTDILPCFELLEKRLVDKQVALDLLNLEDDARTRACHISAREGNTELLSYLEGRGVDLSVADGDGNTCMHLGAAGDSLKTVSWCVDHKHDPHALDKRGRSPLHVAAAAGATSVCEYLISKFPSLLSLPDAKGRLPLHYAIMSYAPERGVDSNDVEDLLSIFIENDHKEEKLRQFVVRTHSGMCSLHFAAYLGLENIIRLIKSVLREAESQQALSLSQFSLFDNGGRSPLHFLAMASPDQNVDADALEQTVNLKTLFADILAPDHKRRTPLHYAAHYSNLSIVNFLIAHYPDWVRKKDKGGWTALHTAAMFGTRSIISTLSSNWPKGLMTPTKRGRVPLHLMVLRHNREKGLHISFLSSLLKANDAAAKVLDRTGNSPLSLACSMGNLNCVKILAPASADVVNARNSGGKTPLFCVLSNADLMKTASGTVMVQLLLSNGADKGATGLIDGKEESPLAYAERLGFGEEILNSLGKLEASAASSAASSSEAKSSNLRPSAARRSWARRDQGAGAAAAASGEKGIEVAAKMSQMRGLQYRKQGEGENKEG